MDREQPYGKKLERGMRLAPEHFVVDAGLGLFGGLQHDAGAGAAAGAAQVSVAPDGSALVVSERVSNRLETLPLDDAGTPGAPVITASNGNVPFGFAIGHRGDV